MGDMTIRAIIAEPNKNPRTVRINNDFKNFRKIIGGEPEVLRLGDNLAAICDANGALKDLPFCGIFKSYFLVGNVILAGIAGDEITDFPMTLKELRDYPGISLENK